MTYKDKDETFLLFENILLEYLPLASKMDKIKVNESDNELFFGFEIENNCSLDKGSQNWNDGESLADAFMFYKSIGLIFLDGNNYYIDSKKLLKKMDEYWNYIKFINQDNEYLDINDKSDKSYKKGPKK